MACYHPLYAYRGPVSSESGKRSVVFKKRLDAYKPRSSCHELEVTLPCGSCLGCRLDRSRDWAIRCFHEASLHEKNCFLTLTYSEVPSDGSVHLRDIQLFMKRLRKKYGDGIRFFHCGEYGSQLRRPHYHVLVFNFDFEDRVHWSGSGNNRLYVSQSLGELWPLGFSTVGDVTFESAGYVARYILKKVNGSESSDHYRGLSPEYITMSRRPGIGFGWYQKFKDDVYPEGSVVVDGRKFVAPAFYDRLFEKDDPAGWEALKKRRMELSNKGVFVREDGQMSFVEDVSPSRLAVREKVKKLAVKSLVRPMEVSV